jgi:hypothetical protein
MLARVHEANKKNRARKEDWMRRRYEKIMMACADCGENNGDKLGLVLGCDKCQPEYRNLATMPTPNPEKLREFWDKTHDCQTCDTRITARIGNDCENCGKSVCKQELERVLLGNNVVGLFPNIKSKNSARIVRYKVEESSLEFEGFDYKQGGRYIVMNRHYTGDLKPLWNVLPWRRKNKGTAPGMSSAAVNAVEDNPEYQWIYPKAQPTKLQMRQIISRCCEIAVRILFEHFVYKFGTTWYHQSSGGPIGARVTMVVARLVMSDWGKRYKKVLIDSGIPPDLLGGYVDDGRQESGVLAVGMEYDKNVEKFVHSEEAEIEDLARNESSEQRMARRCLVAMNSLNEDLVFTVEVASDFPDKRLPTLDFFLWPEEWGLNHSFFQKSMRTPYVTMRRSAMGDQQKYSILANDLVRRLSNININRVSQEEIMRIIEDFIQMLVTSGYERNQAREIIVSGVRGWKNKRQRREDNGQDFYRSAASSLLSRYKKKLTARTSWYKNTNKNGKRKYVLDEEEEEDMRRRNAAKRAKKPREEPGQEETEKIDKNTNLETTDKNKNKAVLFVPYTVGSILAKRLREAEENLLHSTGYKLKIVERSGSK